MKYLTSIETALLKIIAKYFTFAVPIFLFYISNCKLCRVSVLLAMILYQYLMQFRFGSIIIFFNLNEIRDNNKTSKND